MSIKKKIYLYFYTIRYLKWIQIYYQVFYLVRRFVRRFTKHQYRFDLPHPPHRYLNLIDSINVPTPQIVENQTFIFLNLSHQFQSNIDWDYALYGKLWTYNLNYFEFLHQKEASSSYLSALIKDFVAQLPRLKTAIEPFPIALRAIFWIRFFAKHPQNVTEEAVQSLYCQLKILQDNLEYHILGNHLLENGFSLLFGAYFFEDKSLYQSAKQILIPELKEQILSDGAHFELSPMYHQIMLYRILDCINLMKSNPTFNNELLPLFQEKASKMLSWLKQMTFSNGHIPYLNDSTAYIAPTTQDLLNYAERLKINYVILPLSESGYRCFNTPKYELRIDVGNIIPEYQPAHAHSDTFNFVLNIDNQPFIVDTGISTYEKNEQRQIERSTQAHNTVQIENKEQSEIWDGFRVAKRAYSKVLNESSYRIEAKHDGYQPVGFIHKRIFEVTSGTIFISDKVISDIKGQKVAYLHFHPTIEVILKNKEIDTKYAKLMFSDGTIVLGSYLYCDKFNRSQKAIQLMIYFEKELITQIVSKV
jgi:uncharacterized heparinase superfamily protein